MRCCLRTPPRTPRVRAVSGSLYPRLMQNSKIIFGLIVAGLLNFLVILDAFDVGMGRK